MNSINFDSSSRLTSEDLKKMSSRMFSAYKYEPSEVDELITAEDINAFVNSDAGKLAPKEVKVPQEVIDAIVAKSESAQTPGTALVDPSVDSLDSKGRLVNANKIENANKQQLKSGKGTYAAQSGIDAGNELAKTPTYNMNDNSWRRLDESDEWNEAAARGEFSGLDEKK